MATSSTASTSTTTVTDTSSLAKMCAQASELDMVFAMDCTGSMGSYIASAQASVRSMIEEIVSAEKADVRFALVAYRDHPPQDSTFITKVYNFTSSVSKMRQSLGELSAAGGGDGPEAVEDALHEVSKLDYRPNATKIAVLIADAPPHGLDQCGDGFPDGCPLGLDPMTICRDLAAKGITLYTIGCEPAILRYKEFFAAMAHLTGGQYCPLQSANVLSSVIVGGAREEISLERLMGEVNDEVAALGREMNEEEQAEEIHRRLKAKKVTTKQLLAGKSALSEASKDAVEIASSSCMAEVRTKFAASAPPSSAPSSFLSSCSSSSGGSSMKMKRSCAAPRMASMAAPAPKSAAPPKPSGVLDLFSSFFSSASAAPAAASAAPEGEDHLCDLSASEAAPAPSSFAPASYSVAEEEVSLAQCKRMVKKSRARQGWDA